MFAILGILAGFCLSTDRLIASVQVIVRQSVSQLEKSPDPLPRGAIAKLGSDQFQQEQPIDHLALSPCGRFLASASREISPTNCPGCVRIWSLESGKEVCTFSGFLKGWITQISFSPTGQTLASACYDGFSKLWDVQSGKELLRFDNGQGEISGLAFSPDGAKLATARKDCTVGVWKVSDGKELGRVSGKTPKEWMRAVVFSADGKFLVGADLGGSVYVWDANSLQEKYNRHSNMGSVKELDVTVDGKLLVRGGDERIQIWELDTGKLIREVSHSSSAKSACFSPDGKFLAAAGGFGDYAISIWDCQTGKLIVRAGEKEYLWDINSCVFSQDSRKLFTGSECGAIRQWDVATGMEIIRVPQHTNRITAIAFSKDDRYVVSGCVRGSIAMWEAKTGFQLHLFPQVEGPIKALAVSPDGARLCSINQVENNFWMIRLWEVNSRRELIQWREVREKPYVETARVVFSDDGQTLVASIGECVFVGSLSDDKKLIRISDDKGSGEILEEVSHLFVDDREITWATKAMRVYKFTRDSKKKVEGVKYDNHFESFDFRGGRLATLLNSGFDLVRLDIHYPLPQLKRLAYQLRDPESLSPDGKWLIAPKYSADISFHCVEVSTGKVCELFQVPPGRRTAWLDFVLVSNTGRFVATVNNRTHTALLWDLSLGGKFSNANESSGQPSLRDSLQELRSIKSKKVFASTWALVGSAEESVALIKEQFRPSTAPKRERVNELIEQLDSEEFSTRDAASKALANYRETIESHLKSKLESSASPEATRRLNQLLDRIQPWSNKHIIACRITCVLEYIGSKESIYLLKSYASGNPDEWLTREANKSLGRLQHKNGR